MRILITAGPTREYLDDVRYLSNASSGRMGYALAAEAVARGHHVVLVSGPVELSPPKSCDLGRSSPNLTQAPRLSSLKESSPPWPANSKHLPFRSRLTTMTPRFFVLAMERL